jgi:Putative beta-barrel porin-2, OmpL-like. bbp2
MKFTTVQRSKSSSVAALTTLVLLMSRFACVREASAQVPAGATSGAAASGTACPPAAANAVAELRAAWPQALSAAAAACLPVSVSPSAAASAVAAPSPVAAATPVPPLTTPSVTGPLQWQSPTAIDLSTMLGLNDTIPTVADLLKFDINGVVSGIGIVQNHAVSGDRSARADASNAQVMIQKPDGQLQYYLQLGVYSIPDLGLPYISSGKAVDQLFGPMPVAFAKIAPNEIPNFSLLAGNLPTLFGAEYTFTFENMNIERGLVWNQENLINRGVQANYSLGPVSASVSWNNGFYSNSYTWLDGSLAWAINSANTVSFVGGGNVGFSKFSNFATSPLLNNSQIYNLIYTYSNSPWIIQPYIQGTVVGANSSIGVGKTTYTIGGALLASYALTDNFFLAARAEGIGQNGSPTDGSVNLLYGPGSQAWSVTLTPTYQYKKFFLRGEVSYVQAESYTSGDVFGNKNQNPSQVRGVLETGLLF